MTDRTRKPLVSVITPSLNQGRFLEENVLSIREQTYPFVEHIVVDGGSNDETVSILEKHGHLQWVSEKDRGQAHAVNKGFALAGGDIIGWLNADDVYLPNAVQAAVDAFLADGEGRSDQVPGSGIAAVYGDIRHVHEDRRTKREYREQNFRRYDLLWGHVYIASASTFVARWAWERVGGAREDLQYAMDLDLFLRLSEVGRIVHVPEILAEFRWHGDSKSGARGAAVRGEARMVNFFHAERELGRRPSEVEFEVRRFFVRAARKLRFARRRLFGIEA